MAMRDQNVVDALWEIGKRIAIACTRKGIADHWIGKDARLACFDQYAGMTEVTDSHAFTFVGSCWRRRRRFAEEGREQRVVLIAHSECLFDPPVCARSLFHLEEFAQSFVIERNVEMKMAVVLEPRRAENE